MTKPKATKLSLHLEPGLHRALREESARLGIRSASETAARLLARALGYRPLYRVLTTGEMIPQK